MMVVVWSGVIESRCTVMHQEGERGQRCVVGLNFERNGDRRVEGAKNAREDTHQSGAGFGLGGDKCQHLARFATDADWTDSAWQKVDVFPRCFQNFQNFQACPQMKTEKPLTKCKI